jgi:hypothetical protein
MHVLVLLFIQVVDRSVSRVQQARFLSFPLRQHAFGRLLDLRSSYQRWYRLSI